MMAVRKNMGKTRTKWLACKDIGLFLSVYPAMAIRRDNFASGSSHQPRPILPAKPPTVGSPEITV
jgi:hypothetical protein